MNSRGKPNFDPTFQSPEVDPFAQLEDNFAWEELEGWDKRDDDDIRAKALQTLRHVFRLAATPARSLDQIGRRTLAILWVIDPGFFEGNQSLTDLATSYGLHKVLLSRIAREASKSLGIANAFQQTHDWKNHQHMTTRSERRKHDPQKKGPRRSGA